MFMILHERKANYINFEEPIVAYARELRKNQTEAENKMWNLLRNRKFHGYKFRRQHPVSKLFILDFYCLEKQLAIELDGEHHNIELQKQNDDERTDILNKLGIRVIRFSNTEVMQKTDEVLKKILDSLTVNCTDPSSEK
jgi:very-short-patch-repair endonuclease